MADANPAAIKREDFSIALRQYDPPLKLTRERDALSGRYRIQMTQPLPEFNSPFAKAYAARDDQFPNAPLYALIFDHTMPPRARHVAALKEFRHPNLVALVEEGVAEISTLGEARTVVILERPTGLTLSQHLSQQKPPLSDSMLLQNVVRPLAELLVAFAKMGISHNRINLDTLYLSGAHIMLGECISEPSGFSQYFIFEPVERVLASPWGKADIAMGADYFALAVTALHLLLGFKPYTQMGRDEYISDMLGKGPYHTLAIQWDIPETLQDFFRGILNDARRERWDAETLAHWVAGKRFNLILPSPLRETSRGFEFAGQNYFNCKALAHALTQHWQEARAMLLDNALSRWLETSVRKPEAALAVTRVIANDTTRSERTSNETVAKLIIILDPQGPIRLRQLAVHPEGVSQMLAHAFMTKNQEEIQLLLQVIEGDLVGFWLDQQKVPADNALNLKLQKIRTNLRLNSLGFGMERCLYDISPGLPCQSPLVVRYNVGDVEELLLALDAVAAQAMVKSDCMDRHIAGFIGARLNIAKEIHIHELNAMAELAGNPKLVGLKLLARAQQKEGNPALKGLGIWVGMQLLDLLEHIHKRSLIRELQGQLRDVSARGLLQPIANILLNPDTFVADHNQFRLMANAYARRNAQITELKNHTYLARHARIAGRGIAQTVAYTVSLVTAFLTLKSYFHY